MVFRLTPLPSIYVGSGSWRRELKSRCDAGGDRSVSIARKCPAVGTNCLTILLAKFSPSISGGRGSRGRLWTLDRCMKMTSVCSYMVHRASDRHGYALRIPYTGRQEALIRSRRHSWQLALGQENRCFIGTVHIIDSSLIFFCRRFLHDASPACCRANWRLKSDHIHVNEFTGPEAEDPCQCDERRWPQQMNVPSCEYLPGQVSAPVTIVLQGPPLARPLDEM